MERRGIVWRIFQHLAHRRSHEFFQLGLGNRVVICFEHLGAAPTKVVDQCFQGAISFGRGGEQFTHLLDSKRGVEVADRVRRDTGQSYPNRA